MSGGVPVTYVCKDCDQTFKYVLGLAAHKREYLTCPKVIADAKYAVFIRKAPQYWGLGVGAATIRGFRENA